MPSLARKALALLVMLCLGLTVLAPRAGADAFDRARLAPLASSERLRLFTLARAQDTRRAPPAYTNALRRALRDTGFYNEGGAELMDRSLRFSPILTWDDNINGGYFHDRLVIGGLIFDADPASRARAGLMLGGRLDATARLSWAEGRIIDLRAMAEIAWSPVHDIGRGAAGVEVCARNHVTGWTFVDVCASASASRRALTEGSSTGISAALVHLFSTAGAAHQISLEVDRRALDAGQQTGATLGWSAVWNGAVTEFTLGTATPIAGATATRGRIGARVGFLWRDRPVSVSAWHVQASGGMLLGMAREDHVTGLGLSIEARRGMSIEVTHQVTTSTIALFEDNRTGLSVRFRLGQR